MVFFMILPWLHMTVETWGTRAHPVMSQSTLQSREASRKRYRAYFQSSNTRFSSLQLRRHLNCAPRIRREVDIEKDTSEMVTYQLNYDTKSRSKRKVMTLTVAAEERVSNVERDYTISVTTILVLFLSCSIRYQRRNLDRNVHLSRHCATFVGTVLLISLPWHWLWRFSWTCSVCRIGADCSQVSTLSGHWRDACCIPSTRKLRARWNRDLMCPCTLCICPNNVCCGSERLGTHEYVNVSMVAVMDWITKGRDVNEEPVTVCLVFDDFSHGSPRRCWVHRF